jgi:Flp pilus assembly protein CpaB
MTARRDRRVILLALLLASAAAFLAYALLASRPQTVSEPVEAAAPSGEPVLIAARPINEGEVLEAADIEVAYVAAEAKAPRVLTESAQAIGDVALVAIPKGEQILASSVGNATASAAPQTFAGDVPVGMRAVAIALEETVGAGGLVQPGDRVDVIASYQLKPIRPATTVEEALGMIDDRPSGSDTAGEEKSGDASDAQSSGDDDFPVAELLVQDVAVLAIGQSLGTTDAPPPATTTDETADAAATTEATGPAPRPDAASVTLLVDPSQALRLLLAVQADGTFRLLLRSPGDTTTTELPPALITNGAIQMPPFDLVGANLAAKDLVVTGARFRQTSVPGGGMIEFEATVRNISSRVIPAGRGGAGPGHEYRAGQTWRSLADVAPPGVYSLGVTAESAQDPAYPWRWDLGQDLAPGESATITGAIQAPNAAGAQRWWFGTLLQPGTVQDDGVASTRITIEPVESVVVVASVIDIRESPWPSAASVMKAPRGTKADVLQYRDGWFEVRVDGRDGWVVESAVANAVLPEAAAALKAAPAATPAATPVAGATPIAEKTSDE